MPDELMVILINATKQGVWEQVLERVSSKSTLYHILTLNISQPKKEAVISRLYNLTHGN